MRKKPSKTITKLCPFLDENCSKENCEIYNSVLDRCELGLLNYNIYQLMTVMKQLVGIEIKK